MAAIASSQSELGERGRGPTAAARRPARSPPRGRRRGSWGRPARPRSAAGWRGRRASAVVVSPPWPVSPTSDRDQRAGDEREGHDADVAWRGHRRDDDEERRRRDVPGTWPRARPASGRSPRPRTASATRAAGRAAMASRPSPAPARGGRHAARRAPSQPTTSRSAANTGARPVKCEYSIHASGTHAAIASGRSTSTSAPNAHAPASARPSSTSRVSSPPATIATRSAPPATTALRHGPPGQGGGVRAGGQAPGERAEARRDRA